ncbi:uncharacterized protein LOC120416704 [Culex pipiens pallens]|uniref:uncharacterized protein LOC120416704 n=1 Tax=Culex pipiens pallens TaxID=42434 RepID=UPI0022AAF3CA|nr:uncharacterized protein LOC120416704 [Culex pipiens pallens]
MEELQSQERAEAQRSVLSNATRAEEPRSSASVLSSLQTLRIGAAGFLNPTTTLDIHGLAIGRIVSNANSFGRPASRQPTHWAAHELPSRTSQSDGLEVITLSAVGRAAGDHLSSDVASVPHQEALRTGTPRAKRVPEEEAPSERRERATSFLPMFGQRTKALEVKSGSRRVEPIYRVVLPPPSTSPIFSLLTRSRFPIQHRLESRLCCRAQQHRSGRLRPPSSLGSRRRIEVHEQKRDVMVNGDTCSHTPATTWWHIPRPQRRQPMATQLAHSSPHWRHHDPHTVETKSATTVASHAQAGNSSSTDARTAQQIMAGGTKARALFRGGTQAANHHTTVTKLHNRCSTRRAAHKPQYIHTLTYSPHTHKGSTVAALSSGNTATTSGKRPHSYDPRWAAHEPLTTAHPSNDGDGDTIIARPQHSGPRAARKPQKHHAYPYVRAVHEAPNQHQFSEPNAESGVPAPRHLGVARSWSDGPEQPPRHFPKISPAGTSLKCQPLASYAVDVDTS